MPYIGRGLYYSKEDPCLGKELTYRFTLTFQPNNRLSQSVEFFHNHMDGLEDQGRLYTLNIINSHTSFQFNRYFFMRGIVQYDSYQDKVLLDALASFTFIPGTVIHLGYGSLYKKKAWIDNEWTSHQGRYYDMKKSLFFKASYLWRI